MKDFTGLKRDAKIIRWALVFALTLPLIASFDVQTSVSQTTSVCTGAFIPVSTPLNDLGMGNTSV